MKKRLFFFLLISLMFLKIGNASTYLTEFEAINGRLSLPFASKNNIYTIYLEENATSLDFRYELEDKEATVEIIDNKYEEAKENIMIIKVTKDKDSQNYMFYLEKEQTSNVALDNTLPTDLSLQKEKEIPYLKEIMITSCGFIILILFKFLILNFFKKKHHLK